MSSNKLHAEFCNLVAQLLDGQINQNNIDRLNELMQQDDQLMHMYLDIVSNHMAMNDNGDNILSKVINDINQVVLFREAIEVDEQVKSNEQKKKGLSQQQDDKLMKESMPASDFPQQPRTKINKEKNTSESIDFQFFVKKVSFVAACIVLGFIGWHFLQSNNQVNIAQIKQTMDAQWSVDSAQLTQGKDYFLEKGQVDIELNNGIIVRFEGPSKFNIKSENVTYLEQGKLRADTPGNVKGYTIQTPSATYINRGTKYSIQVYEDGRSELYVLEGLVEITTISHVFERVTAGQARSISSDGKNIKHIVVDHSFSDISDQISDSTRSENSVILSPDESSGLSEYEKLMTQFRPVRYYSFNDPSPDQMEHVLQSNNIDLILDNTTPMQSAGNRVLSLDDGQLSYISLKGIEQDLSEASMMFWFKVDFLPDGDKVISILSSCMFTEEKLPLSDFNFEKNYQKLKISNEVYVNADGVLTIQCDYHKILQLGEEPSLVSDVRLQQGQWYFIVITYNQANVMTFYVNGELQDTLAVDSHLVIEPWQLILLGVRFIELPTDKNYDSFSGQFDDLALFDQALTGGDIMQIYEMASIN